MRNNGTKTGAKRPGGQRRALMTLGMGPFHHKARLMNDGLRTPSMDRPFPQVTVVTPAVYSST